MAKRTGNSEVYFDRNISEVLAKRIRPFTFQVGILNDRPHKKALPKSFGHKGFPGGIARRVSTRIDGTLASISKKFRKFLGFNFYTFPFRGTQKNRLIVQFTESFLNMAFKGAAHRKRCENLLQAIVRNPILRKDYGPNSRGWAKVKGFNHKGVDTGQLFKGITARVMRKQNGS